MQLTLHTYIELIIVISITLHIIYFYYKLRILNYCDSSFTIEVISQKDRIRCS